MATKNVSDLINDAMKLQKEVFSHLEAYESKADTSIRREQQLMSKAQQFLRLTVTISEEVSKTGQRPSVLLKSKADRLTDDAKIVRAALERVCRNSITNMTPPKQGDHVENAIKEGATWESSLKMMNEMIVSGGDAVRRLVDGNDRLRGMQKKSQKLASSLGLSTSLLGVIQRRTTADAILVYGLMFITLVVFIGLWCWVKS